MPVPARSDGVSLLPTLTGHADQQKPGIVYAEYNFAGKTPEYKDFLGEHKGAQRGQQQIVFVDGLKGLRILQAGTSGPHESRRFVQSPGFPSFQNSV